MIPATVECTLCKGPCPCPCRGWRSYLGCAAVARGEEERGRRDVHILRGGGLGLSQLTGGHGGQDLNRNAVVGAARYLAAVREHDRVADHGITISCIMIMIYS